MAQLQKDITHVTWVSNFVHWLRAFVHQKTYLARLTIKLSYWLRRLLLEQGQGKVGTITEKGIPHKLDYGTNLKLRGQQHDTKHCVLNLLCLEILILIHSLRKLKGRISE